MSIITKIPSEIRNFFTGKRINPAFSKFITLFEEMRFSDKDLGGRKRENYQLTNLQLFLIILILPFMAVPDFSHHAESPISKLFGGKKDLLYWFMAKDNIGWRNIIWRRMECIGMIFSHVYQRCILGYKLLAMCWSDGRSQFVVDFSIHGEKGKIDGKEQGLTARQCERRYNRKRDSDCQTQKRKEEYFVSKLERLKSMVKDAIGHHIPFDYLLVDSWFVCTELVDFVCGSHKRFHLLGMAKMGNAKYKTDSTDELTAKAILNAHRRGKDLVNHY